MSNGMGRLLELIVHLKAGYSLQSLEMFLVFPFIGPFVLH